MKETTKLVYLTTDVPKWGLKSGPVLLRVLDFLKTKFEVYCASLKPGRIVNGVRPYEMEYRQWWWPPARLGLHTRLRASRLISSLQLRRSDRILVVYPNHMELAEKVNQLSGASYDVIVHDLHEDQLARDCNKVFLRRAASIFCVSEKLVEVMGQYNERSFLIYPVPGDDLGLFPSFAKNKPIGLAGGFNSKYIEALSRLNQPILAIGPKPKGPQNNLVSFIDRFPDNDEAVKFVSENCSALAVIVPEGMGNYEEYSFPSKILDFSRSGLPIIVMASRGSSIGSWAVKNDWQLYIDDVENVDLINSVLEKLSSKQKWESCQKDVLSARSAEFNPKMINELMLGYIQDTL